MSPVAVNAPEKEEESVEVEEIAPEAVIVPEVDRFPLVIVSLPR